jgi:hypothetical protein
VAAAPGEVWPWLVEPPRLARWLADEATRESPASPLLLAGTGEAGEPRRERATTVEIDPPRLWIAAFERLDAGWPAATRLAVRLHPTPGGTEVDVLHEGFQRLPLSHCLTVWEAYRRRWRAALERLALEVSG